jgi:hypothetical protein
MIVHLRCSWSRDGSCAAGPASALSMASRLGPNNAELTWAPA